MHSRIEPLVSQASELGDRWKQLVARWGSAGLPGDTPYSRLHGATFQEFDVRVMATLDLVIALGKVEEGGQILFLPKVDTAAKQLKAARASVDQLIAELNVQPQALFKDPNGTLDSVQGFLNGGHVTNASAGPHLDQVSANITGLFDVASTGLRFGKAKGLSLYQTYGLQLQELFSSMTALHGEARALRDAAASAKAEASASADDASTHLEACEAAREELASSLVATKAAQAEAEAKLATIRETAKAAGSLETQVEGYEATFDAFQKSLDERVAQHAAFEKNMVDALAANGSREAEIDRLIAKADSMIQGATTAGLGDSLEKTRKLYQDRMVGAGVGFFVSILLLAASAIPLIAHILPGLFSGWVSLAGTHGAPSPSPGGAGDVLVGLLGKVFLMFPATWLTQFFSKAYTEFFHLEREYAHKAALARSVEGFKKQAPKYEEEITTAVFFEVQSNPSKQKAPDAAEHPILGPIMKKLIDALPTGKASDAKTPSA